MPTEATKTILVVEDDPEIREALREILAGEGYAVREAADGADALRALEGGLQPSLIVLDLMMPRMNGWEFRDAQRRDPTLAAIPVIAVSGIEDLGGRAVALGVQGHVAKPIDVTKLLAAIERNCR